ncbi:ribonuclease H-like domain-containing protein [Mucidula mucida]|nr:ribonuclease H-like domain-containing protein [Mucidula mucida]
MPKAKTGFYAVRVGRETGIFDTWERCEAAISGFPGNQHKKLPTRAQAEHWLQSGSISAPATSTPKPVSITSKPASTASKPASSSKSVVKQATVAPSSTGSFNVFARAQSDPPISGEVTVFSDGACKGNGKVGSFAGVGVWWGHDDPRNLAERCPGKQTNNRAELIGIIRVLEQCKDKTHAVRVKTDSKYSMKLAKEWV